MASVYKRTVQGYRTRCPHGRDVWGMQVGPGPQGLLGLSLAQKPLQLPVSSSGTLTPPAHLSPGVERGKDMSAVCPLCDRASFVSVNLFHFQPCKASTTRAGGSDVCALMGAHSQDLRTLVGEKLISVITLIEI